MHSLPEHLRLLIISTSKLHGGEYMDYLLPELRDFLGGKKVLFIPYARPGGISLEEYTQYPTKALAQIDIEVQGIEAFADPKAAIAEAEAIFVGGGNTFLLLKTLYDKGLIQPIRDAVNRGCLYMGSSAGSNISGLSIGTTNDMPIVYPPSFEALGLLPFNVNPHYLDPDPNSTHQGETRETRIMEFHHFNQQPVLGLREGSWLRVEKGRVELKGEHTARLFRAGQKAVEIPNGLLNSLD